MGTAGNCALGCRLCVWYDMVGLGSEEQSQGNTRAHRLVDSEQTKAHLHGHLRCHSRPSVIIDCVCVSACTWISRRQSESVRSMDTTHGSPCRAALPIYQPPSASSDATCSKQARVKFLEVMVLRSMARLDMPCRRMKRLHRLDGNFSTRD
jgi:hypothetical protein